jgi:transposase
MVKLYVREQLARIPDPLPAVIGIDEIAIRKGHEYRIIVSDLEREQPIWYGGVDRSEESMAMFYDLLGAPRTSRIRLAVMDMWNPFRNVTEDRAPGAASSTTSSTCSGT